MLVLLQNDTQHPDQARRQLHSINAHKLETVGANVPPNSIPLRCLNPHATSLHFAFITPPSSSDFELNSHFAFFTILIGCYTGSNVWDCSSLLKSCALGPRQISACSDAFASATVDGIGKIACGGSPEVDHSSRQFMLSECLVKGLVVRQFLRQPGMGHQTHAVVQVPHGTHLALHASRNAHVCLVPQFPNNAIGVW